jgi:hypothetical protein
MPSDIVSALRDKAAGKRNELGDQWGDWICAGAADIIADMVKALERVRPYVANAVRDDGGIAVCDISYRVDLETIDAALAKAKQP